MPTDPYADAAPAPEAPPADEAEPQEETDPNAENEEEGDSQTAEIPKGVLGGKDFKPGEEVVLEVVQVMEDSVLVKYASEKGGEKEEGEPKGKGMMSSMYSDEGGGGNPGPGY